MMIDARRNRSRGSSRRPRARGLAAAALLALLLTACATGDKGGSGIREVWLPASQDFWKSAAAKGVTLYRTNKSTQRIVSGPVIAGLLGAKSRLEAAGSARADLALVDADQPNAFAFPFEGRSVIAFTLPWLDKLGQDPDAIAAVMGHELAHVALGHSAAARREREKSAKQAGHVAGVLLSIIGVPFGGTVAGTAATAYSRSFTRDEERAADELGLQWAIAAGYDPCGLGRVMAMYEGLGKDVPHPWLSTHPGHEERAANASRIAREAGRKDCAKPDPG